jgi:hypothetical protein
MLQTSKHCLQVVVLVPGTGTCVEAPPAWALLEEPAPTEDIADDISSNALEHCTALLQRNRQLWKR